MAGSAEASAPPAASTDNRLRDLRHRTDNVLQMVLSLLRLRRGPIVEREGMELFDDTLERIERPVSDANEDDGIESTPRDDQDGQLLAGLFEYATVYTRQPNTGASGQRRLDIRTAQSRGNLNQLAQRFTAAGLEQARAQQIAQRVNFNNPTYGSVADFLLASQMTAATEGPQPPRTRIGRITHAHQGMVCWSGPLNA